MKVFALLYIGAAAGVGALVGGVVGWPAPMVGGLAGLALLAAGVGLATWSNRLAAGQVDVEERHVRGPNLHRRRMLMRGAAGAAAVGGAVLAVPAWRRLDAATARLRTTRWRAGTRLVDGDGQPVLAAAVTDGELLTVYPEGALDAVDSPAVVVREPLERFAPGAAEAGWVVGGIAAYSKLCTHMACPLGLYQQRTGTLLCPCHQALFDLLDRGRVLQGPAARPLPRLPLQVDADGHLVAGGDFSDAVGTGFWGRRP